MLPALHTRKTSPLTDQAVAPALHPASNAADIRPEQLFQAIDAADDTAVIALLSNGQISANAVHGADGCTALMHATASGHAGIVQALLQAGASVNQAASVNGDQKARKYGGVSFSF